MPRCDRSVGVPGWIYFLVRDSNRTKKEIRKLRRLVIMAVSKNQEKIDEFTAEITDTFDKLADEVAKLKEQVSLGEVLNFTGLETQVKRGQDMEAPVVVPQPTNPDDQDQPDEDTEGTN